MIARLTAQLNTRLADEGVAANVLPGAEIAITSLAEIAAEELSSLTLGGGPWLLLEPPFTQVVAGLKSMVVQVQNLGHSVLVAHPERCPAFRRDREMLEELLEVGALTSVTAGSLVGRFGPEARSFALSLVRDGLVHNVSSDAHNCGGRPPGVAAELEQAGLAPLAGWLTVEVPQAILAGTAIPPRPMVDLPTPEPAARWPWRRRAR